MTRLALCLLLIASCADTQHDPSPTRGEVDPRDAGRDTDETDSPGSDALDARDVPDTDAEPDPRDAHLPEDADAGQDARDAHLPEDVAPDVADTGRPPYADDDVCQETDRFQPLFDSVIDRWAEQDQRAPRTGGLLLVGSSSARRWEAFARTFSDYDPIQRGFGGAQLGEVALRAESLVVTRRPHAVLVFAGTNDLAAGVDVETVLTRFKCLRQRIGRGLGWSTPIVFIGVTPTPARWAGWPGAAAFNADVAGLRGDDPALFYADVATPFLATGAPPSPELFVDDGLHLSAAGYALWSHTIRAEVERALAPLPPRPGPELQSGTRVLVDLGPDNQGDGEATPSPDHLGQQWNNWHPHEGGAAIFPGEHLSLRASDGTATEVELVVTGGFSANGWANGGLRWPDGDLLGALAVGSATGDFFYTEGDDLTGGLYLRGLSPRQRYTIQLFASRADGEVRTTRYTVYGAAEATATLQTSGLGAGTAGTGNDDDVVTFSGVQPDAYGHLFLDVSIEDGAYGYLCLLELAVE